MQAETIPATDIRQAEARLPRWMMAMAAVGTAAALLIGRWSAAGGFALGASLAILNYFWLHQAVETLVDAGKARVPRRVMAKFALRYPLAIAGVYLFYRTGWLPFTAILAGFFVPVAGVLLESMIQIGEAFRSSGKEIGN